MTGDPLMGLGETDKCLRMNLFRWKGIHRKADLTNAWQDSFGVIERERERPETVRTADAFVGLGERRAGGSSSAAENRRFSQRLALSIPSGDTAGDERSDNHE